MKMKSPTLSEFDLNEIQNLAKSKRQELGFIGRTPIANDIDIILEKLKIKLLKYPVYSGTENRLAFSAAIIFSKENGDEYTFLGLNTADYYDKQVFAIAHELYHFYTRTGIHLSRVDTEHNMIETRANRFAAEFLLPETEILNIIIDDFKKSSLLDISDKVLFRFIAKIHCDWWLPYRSIVKRLLEIGSISNEQYNRLYAIHERNIESDYYKTGLALNKNVFTMLNSISNEIGTNPPDIEVIIRNFENNLIDEESFNDLLNMFGKNPDDFGYKINVIESELDEFSDLFTLVDSDED